MKDLFESFKKSFPWILGSVIVTAILDLIGLGTVDAAGKQWNIGLGFILAVVLMFALVLYHPKKKV